MTEQELKRYQAVQNAARRTLDEVTEFIRPGISEIDLVKKCDELQRAAGIDSYWYQSLPALALIGDRTTLAISRMPYAPDNIRAKENDLVTIDLNPAISGYCGDCARSYYIEDGETRRIPRRNAEFLQGAEAQKLLHALLKRTAHPDLTFNDLHQTLHEEIERLGFEQLDYLGHSIGKETDQLVFIAPGSNCLLGETGLFTLEPHLRLKQSNYGFKHENIYYFKGQALHEL
ncbi:MAG TPA: M24 family metallopeptidase [Novimethylophilus sp.]|jgi:Xaa-Pro aminopeptidase|uniref:M24 family metallopeptidase n=1 Tax=Novimethylophilus sp. TaxID=2137426 RepID=UPI002F3E3884